MEEKKATFRRKRNRSFNPSESFLIRHGCKYILGLVVVVLFLTIVQCSFNKPEAPTWNTNFTLPLVNRTYHMEEILEKIDQPGLFVDSSGSIVFEFETVMDTVDVDGELTATGFSDSFNEKVGPVDLNPSNPPAEIITPVELGFALENVDIPECWLDTISLDFDPISEFSWAVLEPDTIFMLITNDFGVSLDTTIINLYDDVYGFLLSSTVYDQEIPPDGLPVAIPLEVNGQVTNDLLVRIICHTPGGLSLSLTGKSIGAQADFADGVTVTSALARIPQIDLDFSDQFNLTSGNSIHSAELASGTLQLDLINNSNLETTISLSIPDLVSNSFPIDTVIYLPPQTSDIISYDLQGYSYVPAVANSVAVNAGVQTTATTGMVVVDQNDSVQVNTILSNIDFISMTGIIEPTGADFDEAIALDIPDGFDSLQLLNAQLDLEIINGFSFPGTLNLIVTGNNGRQLLIPSTAITAGNPDNPVTTVIVADNLADFLNPVPTSVTVTGTAVFGDGITFGTVTRNDYVTSSLKLSSPLEFILIGQPQFTGDTTGENLDDYDMKDITDNLVQAEYTSNIVNSLPIGVNIKLYMDPDQSQLNDVQADLVREFTVQPGTTSSVNLVLDSLDVEVLRNPYIYVTQDFTLMGTGAPASLSVDDSIVVQGWVDIEYHFDGDF